jgi:tetratricopeptide (TPR) repeat protein
MDEPREDRVYHQINRLIAVQIAGLVIVVFGVATLAIVYRSQFNEAHRRIGDLEQRLLVLEGASGEVVIPGPADQAEPVGRARRQDLKPAGLRPARLSRLSERLTVLAQGLTKEPTPEAMATVAPALRELEALRASASELDPPVAASVASLYLATEQYEKAAAWAGAAREHGATDLGTAYTLASALHGLGRYEQAIGVFQQLGSRQRLDPRATLLRGQIELALGQNGQAEETLRAAVAFDEVAAEAAAILARRYLQRGDAERAAEVVARAEAVAPTSYNIARLRAMVLFARGQYHESIEAASILLAVDAADVVMLRMLGEARLATRQAKEAMEPLQTLVSLRPDDASAHALLGKAMLARHLTAEAVERLGRAVQLAPDDATSWYQLGVAHANGDRLDEAVETLDRALALDEGFANAHFARAVCLARGGQAPEAREALRRALSLDAALMETAGRVEVFRGILDADGVTPRTTGP